MVHALSFALAVQEAVVLTAADQALRYTANDVLTFIAAVGVLIGGLGAVIVNIIVALRTGSKVDEQGKKTDGLIGQVKQVHDLTNSALSEVKRELATSNALNTQLRDIIADLKGERAKTAALVAHSVKSGSPRIQDERAGDASQLAKIETNTAEIADNTKLEKP